MENLRHTWTPDVYLTPRPREPKDEYHIRDRAIFTFSAKAKCVHKYRM
jgi:hypothetical protein